MKLHQKIMIFAFSSTLLFGVIITALSIKRQYDANLAFSKEIAVIEHQNSKDLMNHRLDEYVNLTATGLLTDEKIEKIIYGIDGLVEVDRAIVAEPSGILRGNIISITSYITIQDRHFMLQTEYKADNLFAGIKRQAPTMLIYSLIAAIVISAASSFIVYLTTSDIKKLENVFRKIAAGKYDTRAAVMNGELKNACIAVNDMAEAVEQNVGKLSDIAESRKIFVDSMAHEMKTPLTSILCMGDLLKLKKDVSEKDRRDYAGVIVEEAKRMKELSYKLLAIASTDNASLTLEFSSTADIINEISAALAPICQKAEVTLFCEGIDGMINVDRELIKSLFSNLVDNALKASAPGNAIGIRYAPEGRMMKVIVADQGIGMKREDIKRATEPFYMADKARSRKAGGAGLGLSLCASIAKKHNATIEIKSELGKGTIVIVALPLADRRENV